MKPNTDLQEQLAVLTMTRLPTCPRNMWRVLDTFLDIWGVSPTYDTLAIRSHCALGSVVNHLHRLDREHVVIWRTDTRRSIQLLLRYPQPDTRPPREWPWVTVIPQCFMDENSPIAEGKACLTLARLREPARRVWYHVDHFMEQNGAAPTLAELGELCGTSKGAAAVQLHHLQIRRVLQRAYYKPRVMRLLLRYPAAARAEPFPERQGPKPGPRAIKPLHKQISFE